MATLKILHIATYKGGGAGTAAIRLHKELLAHGWQSKFLFFDKGTVTNTEFQYKKRPYLWQLALRIFRKFGMPLNREQKNEFSIRRHKRKVEMFSFANTAHTQLHQHPLVQECDIVHLHWVANFIDYTTFFTNVNKPVVWTLHDMNPFLGGFHYKGDENRWGAAFQRFNDKQLRIKRSALQNLPPGALTVVTPSQWLMHLSEKSELLGRFPHYCIPNGIDTKIFTSKDENTERKNGKINVLFVAESLYNYRKGFDMVLEILQDATITDAYHFTAVGDEKKGSKIPSISYTRVVKSEQTMSELYKKADIFLLPSREDNLPNTMLESLCCGTPVVGFVLGGLPETITNGENGYLSEDVSAAGLKKALQTCTLNLNKLDRKTIGENARHKFAAKAQIDAFEKLYPACLRSYRGVSVVTG